MYILTESNVNDMIESMYSEAMGDGWFGNHIIDLSEAFEILDRHIKSEPVRLPREVGEILDSLLPKGNMSLAYSINPDNYSTGSFMNKWLKYFAHQELFAQAWLTQHYIHEDMYYVLDANRVPLLVKVDGKVERSVTGRTIDELATVDSFKLTLKQIEDYDTRYLEFKEEV